METKKIFKKRRDEIKFDRQFSVLVHGFNKANFSFVNDFKKSKYIGNDMMQDIAGSLNFFQLEKDAKFLYLYYYRYTR